MTSTDYQDEQSKQIRPLHHQYKIFDSHTMKDQNL